MTVVVAIGACTIPQSLNDDTLLGRTLNVLAHGIAAIAAIVAFPLRADRQTSKTVPNDELATCCAFSMPSSHLKELRKVYW